MLIRFTLAVAILHIALLSMFHETQVTVLLMCLRISGLSIACFQDIGKLLNETYTRALLVSNLLNTLSAGYLLFSKVSIKYLVNLEWAWLVFEMMIVCVALHAALQEMELQKHIMREAYTNQVQVTDFLISETDFHINDQALFHISVAGCPADGPTSKQFNIVASTKANKLKINKKVLANMVMTLQNSKFLSKIKAPPE